MTVRDSHYRSNVYQQAYTPKFCALFLSFSLFLSLVSVGFYLVSTNALMMQGNLSHRFETDIQDLSKKKRQLQIEMADLSSLYRMKSREGEFQVIAPDEIFYIERGSLALRK